MELRHLRYFIAVAEELNFTKAAQRLHVAQPPLSRQIRQLEEELGAPLFVRGRRGVLLTDAGRVLLKKARALVAKAAEVFDCVRPAQDRSAGIVKIGVAAGLGESVHAVLVEHARRFPGMEIQCSDVLSTLQNQALRERRIDLGFLRPPVGSGLVSERLFAEPFFVLLPKASPLAACRTLRIKQLADEPLLLHDRAASSGVYDKVLEMYRNAGVTPKMVHTSTGPYEQAGVILVASGRGIYVGVGAALRYPVFGRKVSAVALDEPGAAIEVHMAWRKGDNSPGLLAFIESVRKVLSSNRVQSVPQR